MIKLQAHNFNGKIPKQTNEIKNATAIFNHSLPSSKLDDLSFQGKIEYKSASKIRKIFAKFIGEFLEATDNGFDRVAFINRRGKKMSEMTYYPENNKERITLFEKDGKSIKERTIYKMSPSGEMQPTKCVKYKDGKEFYRYEMLPDGYYTRTQKLSNGSYSVDVGTIGKKGETISMGRETYPPDETDMKKEKTFRDYCTEGVSLTVKVKDLEKLKQTHAKAVKEKGVERAGILVVENPYFEKFRAESEKMPFSRWAAKNISQKFGEDVPFPDGDNPEDVLKAYILKDKYLKTHYDKAFKNPIINFAFKKNIGFAVNKYWELVEKSWKELDNIMGDSPIEPKNDIHFNAAADFLRMEVRNEQSHSTFQEILGNYAIKHFEYKPKTKT
jgi:uncharacterized protein YkuJ